MALRSWSVLCAALLALLLSLLPWRRRAPPRRIRRGSTSSCSPRPPASATSRRSPPGARGIQALGTAGDYAVTLSEDAAVFSDAGLRDYEVVVFLHTDGEGILNAAQRTAFERWTSRGGGIVSIHADANADRDWAWKTDMMGGALFANHPAGALQFQNATVRVEDPDHPAMQGIPAAWVRNDEWYNFTAEPRGKVHVLATLDESTYEEQDGSGRGRRPPDRLVLELRRRPPLLHRARPRGHALAGAAATARTSPARSSGRPARPPATAARRARACRPTRRSTRSRSTTRPRTRWRSRSRPTAASTPSSSPAGSSATTRPTAAIARRRHDPGPPRQRERPARHHARPELRDQPLALPLLQRADAPRSSTSRASRSRRTARSTWRRRRSCCTIPHQRIICCHSSGSLTFGPDGNLYISTGDDTRARGVAGLQPDRRPPAQRGRLATRTPTTRSTRAARRATRTTCAARSCASRRRTTARTRSRPATCSASAASSPAWPARRGPRSTRWATATRSGSTSTRRPAGSTTARSAPTRAARTPTAARAATTSSTRSARPATWAGRTASPTTSRTELDFATQTHGGLFDCDGGGGADEGPLNDSAWNTGLAQYAADARRDAVVAVRRTPTRPTSRGRRRRSRSRPAPAAPRSPARPTTSTRRTRPRASSRRWYDDKVFFADWSRDWIATLELDAAGNPAAISEFMPNADFRHPQDIEMGADGSLYVLEWGRDFNYAGSGINPDSGLYRIDYAKGTRTPVAKASGRQGLGPGAADRAVLERRLRRRRRRRADVRVGLRRRRRRRPTPTRRTRSPRPGTLHRAQLTVTDSTGKSASSTVDHQRRQHAAAGRADDCPSRAACSTGATRSRTRSTVTDPEDATIDCDAT